MNTATPGWVWPWWMTGVVEMPVKTEGRYQEAFINPLSLTSAHTDVEYIYRRGFLSLSLSLSLSLRCLSLPCSVQCTGNIIVRRYNSNAKTPLTSMYWDSRYYFYTRDTASVPRDKGRAYMTLWNDDGSRQLLDEQWRALQFRRNGSNFLLLPFPPFASRFHPMDI